MMGWHCHKCEEFHEGPCPQTGYSPGGQMAVGDPGDIILKCPLCAVLHPIPPETLKNQVVKIVEDLVEANGPLELLVVLSLCKPCQATPQGAMAMAWSTKAAQDVLLGMHQ